MKIDKNMVVMGVTVVSSLVSVGAALYSLYRDLKVVNKVDDAVERIEDSNAIEISDKLVENTVKKVVEKRVKEEVDEVTKEIVKAHADQLKAAVAKEIQSLRDQIREDVIAKTKEQVDKLGTKDLRREITAELTDRAYRKLDKEINRITENYYKNLNRFNNIQGGGNSGLVSLNIG